jgi:hypothetical protein
MPANAMCVRLVHLFDEDKRKELMIIYSEDLRPLGFSAVDLNKSGKAHDQWLALEKGLIERAKEKIVLRADNNQKEEAVAEAEIRKRAAIDPGDGIGLKRAANLVTKKNICMVDFLTVDI